MIKRKAGVQVVRSLCSGLLVLSAINDANAQVRLPSLIMSDMVLQQKSEPTLWGWAAPAEVVTVTNSWNNDTVKTVTDGLAHWQLKVKTPAAGGPYTITIKASNTLKLTNVLIGEVWICAGQSNMEWSASRGIKDAKAELADAGNNNIHFFTVLKNAASTPQDACDGEWQVCNARSLNTFSAVGYFFGKKLQKELNVPIGLINITWEGTAAESWTPAPLIENIFLVANHVYATRSAGNPKWPTTNGSIYNGMVAPVKNVDIAGVVWYQGESNSAYPATYSKIFETMIDSWRNTFNKQLPFYYVQIAPFQYYGKTDSAYMIREQQVMALKIAKTGIVVTTDLAEDGTQIHPPYKKEVGNRLANYALAETYNRIGLVYKSPLYQKMEIRKNEIVLYFDNAASGLVCKGDSLLEFTVAGNDHQFYKANARIDKNRIIVKANEVPVPVAVHFAFSNGPLPNLFSKEGLPVSPFRTDNW